MNPIAILTASIENGCPDEKCLNGCGAAIDDVAAPFYEFCSRECMDRYWNVPNVIAGPDEFGGSDFGNDLDDEYANSQQLLERLLYENGHDD